MFQQGKTTTKNLLDFYSLHNKKRKFSCVLYAHSQFLCSLARFDLANSGVRQTAQSHTLYAQLILFHETLASLILQLQIAQRL